MEIVKENDEMERIQHLFLNVHLNETLTGIERASLLRAKLFHEQLHLTPTIVTFRYKHYYRKNCQKHIQEGILHPDLPLLNMYEFLLGTETISEKRAFQQHPTLTYEPVQNTKDYRVYTNQTYHMYIKRHENGLVDYINKFVQKKKVARYRYDYNGYLQVIQTFDRQSQRVVREGFYHVNGHLRIEKHYEIIDKKNTLIQITLFNDKQEIEAVFSDEKELIAYWLTFIFRKDIRYYCYIDKNRYYYQALVEHQIPNIKLIPCIHAMHVRNDQDLLHSTININYRDVFADVTKPNAIVVLTEKQRIDLVKRFGSHDHYYTIPHAMAKLPERVSWVQRDPFKVVVLARYSPEKRLDKMITMFSQVVKEIPQASLELYGFGGEKTKLKELIKTLHMTENIFIHGYASNISEIYNKASLSLLTSKTEAFSLSVMEALAHGCPVISYDIKYGPSDMIHDGENGYLIPFDQDDLYIEKMIFLLKSMDMLRKMSDKAYERSIDFSAAKVSEKWKALIHELG